MGAVRHLPEGVQLQSQRGERLGWVKGDSVERQRSDSAHRPGAPGEALADGSAPAQQRPPSVAQRPGAQPDRARSLGGHEPGYRDALRQMGIDYTERDSEHRHLGQSNARDRLRIADSPWSDLWIYI